MVCSCTCCPRKPPLPSPLTCELALLQETLEEGRVGEEHLLQTLSTHVEDRVDEETAREVGKQGGQVTWETKGSLSRGYVPPHTPGQLFLLTPGLQGGGATHLPEQERLQNLEEYSTLPNLIQVAQGGHDKSHHNVTHGHRPPTVNWSHLSC